MSDFDWKFGLALLAAYLIGSVPWGFVLARRRGVDVRAQGSGNIGATNVARTVGKKLAVVVLLLDASKGAVPVALATLWAKSGSVTGDAPMWCGLAAVVGHCFPVWLGFRGGKGVATGLGVFAFAVPVAAAAGVGVFALLYLSFKVVSIASLSAALTIVGWTWGAGHSSAVAIAATLVFALIVVKHIPNIRRLLRRDELRV